MKRDKRGLIGNHVRRLFAHWHAFGPVGNVENPAVLGTGFASPFGQLPLRCKAHPKPAIYPTIDLFPYAILFKIATMPRTRDAQLLGG